jgi:circadian clock protein KaiC
LFVVDPITNLITVGTSHAVGSMLRRMVDMLKSVGITALFTALTADTGIPDGAETGISSLMDAWLLLRDIEANGERTRGIYVRKSRGMSHSNQIREFLLTENGIDLQDVYIGPAGVLTGAARLAQEAEERAQAEERRRLGEKRKAAIERKRRHLEQRMEALRARYEDEMAALEYEIEEAEAGERVRAENRRQMAVKRRADTEASDERSKI